MTSGPLFFYVPPVNGAGTWPRTVLGGGGVKGPQGMGLPFARAFALRRLIIAASLFIASVPRAVCCLIGIALPPADLKPLGRVAAGLDRRDVDSAEVSPAPLRRPLHPERSRGDGVEGQEISVVDDCDDRSGVPSAPH